MPADIETSGTAPVSRRRSAVGMFIRLVVVLDVTDKQLSRIKVVAFVPRREKNTVCECNVITDEKTRDSP